MGPALWLAVLAVPGSLTVFPALASDIASWVIPSGGALGQGAFQAITVGQAVAAPSAGSIAGLGFAPTIRPIDLMPPRTSLLLGLPKFQDSQGLLFIASSAVAALASVDDLLEIADQEGTGVLEQRLFIDSLLKAVFSNTSDLPTPGDKRGQVLTSSFTLALESEGLHLLGFFAQDALGNAESLITQTIALDKTPPVTRVSLGPLQQNVFGIALVSTSSLITLESLDPVSGGVACGVKAIEFKIETLSGVNAATSGFLAYVSAFSLPQGTHRISFQSMDQVGNKEPEKSIVVAVSMLEAAALTGVAGVEASGTADIRGGIFSNGEVSLKGTVNVTGSVAASTISVTGNGSIAGERRINALTLEEEPMSLALMLETASLHNDNNLIPSKFLDPDSALRVDSQKTLVLGTGTYLVYGLTILSQGSLETQGPVNLFIQGPLSIAGGGLLKSRGNPQELFIAVAGTHRVFLGGGASASLTLYAPRSGISLQGNASVTGHLWARHVTAQGTSMVIQAPEAPSPALTQTTQRTSPTPSSGKGNGFKTASQEASLPDKAFALREVFVFPNPSRQGQKPVFHVEAGLAQGLVITIYDLSGEMLYRRVLNATPQIIARGAAPQYAYEYTLEEPLPTGVYLYLIEAQWDNLALKRAGRFSVVR